VKTGGLELVIWDLPAELHLHLQVQLTAYIIRFQFFVVSDRRVLLPVS
jgi:hypothetical protein